MELRLQPAVAGLLLQLGSTACVSFMSIVAKLAGMAGIPVLQIVFVRSFILLLVSGGMLARQGRQAQWPWRSERRWLLLLRGLLGLGAISTLYYAVQLLPLADVATITFLAPVLVAAAAPLLLHEHTGRGVLAALPLSVVGVTLVAQPTFLFGAAAQAVSALGVAAALAQAGFSAAAKLCIRALGSTEPVFSIILAMAAVSTLGSATLCAVVPGRQWTWHPGVAGAALLGAAGLLGCGVQLLNTQALKLSRAAPTIAMSYVAVVWGLLADLALFHHAPSPLSLAGAALVCASSFLIVFFEQRSSSREAARALRTKQSGAGEVPADAALLWQQPAGSSDEQRLELAEGGRLAGGSGSGTTSRADERAPLVASGVQRSA